MSLTRRENEVLCLLCKGYSYKEISGELFVSMDTVRFHIHNLLSKFSAKDKAQLIVFAIQHKSVSA
ncbi:response regulator transcription factor [Cohnella yongneupensis]|uniref:Response regulator transcription factor n=1 Tax=Cohnella yongneupensis TaxID=425006 RepID=A0ABW0R2K1_9BACL